MSLSVVDKQSATQLLMEPAVGLIDQNLWRSNYGKGHLDYKYGE